MIDPAQLRTRITAPRSDYNLGTCWSCNAVLTNADLEAGRCTNCEPESDDERTGNANEQTNLQIRTSNHR
jgi:hypothetical protein